MRRSKLYPLVALSLSALVPDAAQAQLKDTQWVRPTMMLLVDTSGSMERKPDTSSCVDCLPSCTNSSTDERNRWAITLEALTGTFSSYRCTGRPRSVYTGQYDVSYFLPHYEFTTLAPGFTTAAAQASDGLLDSYNTRLKFGLMTFDGVSTTVNGATLVPFDNYSSVKSNILGLPGQYSYPDATALPNTAGNTPSSGYGWKPLSFPGCLDYYGVNAGSRGKDGTAYDQLASIPGSLVSVGSSDEQSDVTKVNAKIQDSLLRVRPYAGTPIAAMLDDLRYYLNTDTDINSSDPFYNCRKRYAVLLTDGAPDAMFRGGSFKCDSTSASAVATCATYNGVKSCQCPYDTEVSLAGKLVGVDKLKALWVVAFNVNDTTALAALDNIAAAGGTTAASRATNAADLRSALDTILSTAQPDSTSRSVPVVINTGKAVNLGGKQFILSAGFKVGAGSDVPWEGRLYRQRVECEEGAVKVRDLDASKGDIFHETLNSANGTSRTIYTVKPASANTAKGTIFNQNATSYISNSTNVLKPDGSSTFGLSMTTETLFEAPKDSNQGGIDKVSPTLATFDGTMPASYFDGTNATRDNINSYVRGLNGTYRQTHKLGDIYHSNPVVIPPVVAGSELLQAYDTQARSFYVNLIDTTKSASSGTYWGQYGTGGRPGAVFVATNDGLLHAFNLDTWKNKAGSTIDGGTEFWAMLPPAAFNVMSSVVTPTHQYAFDGTPVVKEVILNRDGGVAKVGTVLLIAIRNLPAYMALDVTWPESPKFLWQRSFNYMGRAVGTPALANVRVRWNNTDQIRAVAILPGGDPYTDVTASGSCLATGVYLRGKAPNTGARDSVRCWPLRGRWLYVVDVETGELIQEFDGRHFPSAVTGSVAVDGDGLAVTRGAYFTDADGVLYRLSMTDPDGNPSKWVVAPIWDIYGGNAVNFSGNSVSTVSPDWKMGRTATYAPILNRDPATGKLTIVVGTGDVDNLTDTTANRVVSIQDVGAYNSSGNATPTLNWALQLDAGESVTGPMVTLNDTVYFTSFTGPGNATDKCALGTSRIIGADLRKKDSNNLPLGGLSPESGTGAFVLQYKPSGATGNSLLLGLSIARDPVCFANTTNDPVSGLPGRSTGSNAGGGGFTVRSMVAGDGGNTIGGSNTTDNGQKQFSRTLPVDTRVRSVGWASSIE